MSDLVLFDLDGTLLSGDSDFEWGVYLSDIGAVDAALYQKENERFFRQYREGTLDIDEYLRFALRPLAEHVQDDLLAWRHRFVEEKITPLVQARAREKLDEHKNDTTVIITSTNRFVVAPIAHLFGVDALIATEPTVRGGAYTGDSDAVPCFRENKITHLQRWLAQTRIGYDKLWFYSDSINDLPLLQYVDKPVVVDGDDALSEYAKQHDWPRISLK